MHLVVAIILIAALAPAWDTHGSRWVLKAIAWTAGSVAAFTAIIGTIVFVSF